MVRIEIDILLSQISFLISFSYSTINLPSVSIFGWYISQVSLFFCFNYDYDTSLYILSSVKSDLTNPLLAAKIQTISYFKRSSSASQSKTAVRTESPFPCTVMGALYETPHSSSCQRGSSQATCANRCGG